jgi:hypothetical protein
VLDKVNEARELNPIVFISGNVGFGNIGIDLSHIRACSFCSQSLWIGWD